MYREGCTPDWMILWLGKVLYCLLPWTTLLDHYCTTVCTLYNCAYYVNEITDFTVLYTVRTVLLYMQCSCLVPRLFKRMWCLQNGADRWWSAEFFQNICQHFYFVHWLRNPCSALCFQRSKLIYNLTNIIYLQSNTNYMFHQLY